MKAAATINRAIQVLKQAYRLALKDGRISRIPGRFPMLKEQNAPRVHWREAKRAEGSQGREAVGNETVYR